MPSDSTQQLQLLLNRMNAGDPAARDELIERACERLRRLTRKLFQGERRIRRFEETGDVLQNTLLRLTRRLRNLSEGSAGCPPPATVAQFFSLATAEIRNALKDLARHHFGPARNAIVEMQVQQGSDSAATPEPVYPSSGPQGIQMWTEFHEHVEALPADERAVFELRWYQDLSAAETAEVLGISLATVKRRWTNARLLLVKVLDAAQ